jgi:predicted DNA-binding transcriptional regulator AlpA
MEIIRRSRRGRSPSTISEGEWKRRERQRVLSVDEFSQAYGIGRSKVYDELNSGRLRARKIGKRTMIAEVDAKDWWLNLPTVEEAST